jgi:WD40 repeat protein
VSLLVRDAASGRVLFTIADPGGAVWPLVISGNGGRLLTANARRELRVWGLATGQQLHVLAGHSAPITALAANYDGSRLASAGQDGQLILWDGASGLPLYTLNVTGAEMPAGIPSGPGLGQPALQGGGAGIGALAFSPDGRLVATGEQSGAIKLWQVADHRLVLTLAGHSAKVRSLAFSPDGAMLASGSDDKTARVWDVATGTGLYMLTGSTDSLTGVLFTPDGKELVTGSADGTVRFYLVHIQDLVALARTRITRTLTEAECRQYLHLSVCPAP